MAQQYLFFSERQAAKNGVPPGGKAQPIKSVGVIGAGTMGAGIAINFLNIGIPVVILETEKKFLDAGSFSLSFIRFFSLRLMEGKKKKKKKVSRGSKLRTNRMSSVVS